MVVQAIVEECLSGMGYELVELEHGPGGLMRVYIDFPHDPAERATERQIRIEDCERVSHQLSHVLTVENIDYSRLEVSSPGLDRPLRRPSDFERFVGCEATIKLKHPLQGRRQFEGVLTREDDGRFGVEFDPAPRPAPGKPGSGKKRSNAKPRRALPDDDATPVVDTASVDAASVDAASAAVGGQDAARRNEGGAADAGQERARTVSKLVFALNEVERARLVPKVKF